MPDKGRVSSGIAGLDMMLNGGYLSNSTNLVEGPPGCGKSTLGMQFIYNGAQKGEPGIILTFEELPKYYYRDAAAFGWDFQALERNGLLKVIVSSPEVTKNDLEQTGGILERMVVEMNARRILIDSLTHLEETVKNLEAPAALTRSRRSHAGQDAIEQTPTEPHFVQRDYLYSFINAIKRQGVTTMLTRETANLFGDEEDQSLDSSVHFIVDSYTMLRYVEIESAVKRAVIVLKMRGSAHDSAIRQFEIGAHGMVVMTPFEGQEGIMSGTPKRMADSFIKAFVRK
ncbi:MAG: hypothetical protein JXA21_06275 [Anaerolineae bacterium]|nr:hypothetical protein [Anaerolineae bacterium]